MMRIMFTFAGGNGHFEPLVPIARAAAAAGHTVAVAGQTAMVSAIELAGFQAFPTGGATVGSTPKRLPLLRLDTEREDRALREGYANRTARARATALLELYASWRPDLVVCDEIDFGSMLIAEHLALPYASVQVIAAGSFVRHSVVAAPLSQLRAEYALPPDHALTMLSRYLVLTPFPPSFRDPAFPQPATAHSIGLYTAEPARPHSTPTVYFTLGTVFNIESGDLFGRVLVGLRQLPIEIIAMVGREIDPAEFGPQPANVHLEQYIAQAEILPACDAVVSHGGSGSMLGALAHGLPSVILPMGADQPLNAERCVALGLGRALDAVDTTPEQVRTAVAAVLAEPRYRQAAARMSAEIARLPGPAHAVALLERLGAERRPILPDAL